MQLPRMVLCSQVAWAGCRVSFIASSHRGPPVLVVQVAVTPQKGRTHVLVPGLQQRLVWRKLRLPCSLPPSLPPTEALMPKAGCFSQLCFLLLLCRAQVSQAVTFRWESQCTGNPCRKLTLGRRFLCTWPSRKPQVLFRVFAPGFIAAFAWRSCLAQWLATH